MFDMVIEVHRLCNEHNWFTEGTNRQYEEMFEHLRCGGSISEVAAMIAVCSPNATHAVVIKELKNYIYNDFIRSYSDGSKTMGMPSSYFHTLECELCDKIREELNTGVENIKPHIGLLSLYEEFGSIRLECVNTGRLLLSFGEEGGVLLRGSVTSELIADKKILSDLSEIINKGLKKALKSFKFGVSMMQFRGCGPDTEGIIFGKNREGGYNILLI